jgi:SAM-dependent methyltransferase
MTVPSSEPDLAPGQLTLKRCDRCGSAITTGLPSAGLHDSGAYSPQRPRLHGLAAPILDLFDRQRLSMLRRDAPPPRRLLDVGAGRGRFVAAARRAGYDASGIEPSQRGVAAAAAAGTSLTRATIEDADVGLGSIPALTLWHVLEHVEDPRSALAHIRSWIEPGGVLLIGVPNLASLQAWLGGSRWYHLDVPRHRTHFTARGIDDLLRATGFEPLRAHHVLLEHNPFGMWQTIVNRLTRRPSYLYNLLKRNAPLKSSDLIISVAALALLPVAILLELAAGVCRRGGTVAVVARVPSSSAGYH